MKDLLETRKLIDDVDRQILELFEARMELTTEVAEYKRNTGKPVFDPAREEEKITALKAITKKKENQVAVADLFTQIMSMSRRLQYTMLSQESSFGFQAVEELAYQKGTKVVYFGEVGSYTEQAMMEYFNHQVEGTAMDSFGAVMEAVKSGAYEYGVLPLENSSTGTLSDMFDLLAEYDNVILGEHVVKIEHNLWGLSDAKIEDIKTVYSHRQGLLQCSEFLKNHPEMRPVAGVSTAGSARQVLIEKDKTQGAIASKRAGELMGLKLLQESIHNEANNSTRFIIISSKKIFHKMASRTSLCFVLPHTSGSLYHMLSHFIYNKVNMTRIESRPIPGKAFEYRFFVDVEGHIEEPAVKNALYCIATEALEMKILGCFLTAKV